MLQRLAPTGSVLPVRRLRIIVEDPALVMTDAVNAPTVEVRCCSGPEDVSERCPLVCDDRCPLGPADVVVCNLAGPWSVAVARAWSRAGVPVTSTLGGSLDSAIGAALLTRWAADVSSSNNEQR